MNLALLAGLLVFLLGLLGAIVTSGAARFALGVTAIAGFVAVAASAVAIWIWHGFRTDDSIWPVWHRYAGPDRRAPRAVAVAVASFAVVAVVWFVATLTGVV